jgi:hypothetical protein
MKKASPLLLVLALLLFFPNPSHADSISFNAATGGFVAFTPGVGNSLSVFNVDINQVTVDGVTSAVTGGSLEIISGAEAYSVGTDPMDVVFNAGGILAIMGEVPSLGITTPTQIFSASFLSGAGAQLSSTAPGYFSGGLDPSTIAIDPALLAGNAAAGDVIISVCSQDGNGTFCPNLVNTSYFGVQLSNVNALTTPEPSTMVLLLAGMFGLLLYGKFRAALFA